MSIYRIDQAVYLPNTTTSSSKSTGALIVNGGISTLDNINIGGYLGIYGTTNAVSIKVHAATTAYNYNLPTDAGTSGQILASGGGVAAPNIWKSTTGTGNVVLSSGPTFGVGGLTSTAGTTTLGATNVSGLLDGTSATFSTTLGVTGLTTLTGGLTSTAGTTSLGATNISGLLAGAAATFTTLGATGLATFTGGITSTTGTNTLGSLTNFNVTNGTPPFTVASNTNIPNLNASTLNGATFSVPGDIGSTTPGIGSFTSISTNSTTTSVFSNPLSTINYAYTASFLAPNAAKPGIIIGTTNTDTNYAAINYQTDDSLNISIGTATDLVKITRSGDIISNIGNVSSRGVLVRGSTGGVVSILPQSNFTSYNFNLPSSGGTTGQVLTYQGNSSAMTWTTPSSGTITSITLDVPSFLNVTGSPLTASGTLTVGLSGTALPVANGGTGQTSAGSTGQVLTSQGGGGMIWSNPTLQTSTQTGSNNQVVATDVTGLVYASGSFDINMRVDIVATTSLSQLFKLSGIKSPSSSWSIAVVDVTGDVSGVVFSITSGGQIQYTSSSYAGFVSLNFTWQSYGML